MRKILLILFLSTLAHNVLSQQFERQFELLMPDSVVSLQPTWTDLDNDGLLDILLVSKMLSNRYYLQFVKGDTLGTLSLHTENQATIRVTAFSVVDYNRDNQMDILVSGEKDNASMTVVYINRGNFAFEAHEISGSPFSITTFADLDLDARPEWITSGEEAGVPYFRILQQESDYAWKIIHDTLHIHATGLEVLDANADGYPDFFLSGNLQPDSLFTGFLINHGALYFKPQGARSRAGLTSVGDMNGDGILDVLWMGRDKNQQYATASYVSNGGLHQWVDDPVILIGGRPFLADFNSDGVPDKSYLGKTAADDTVNVIRFGARYDTLHVKDLVNQQFGDLEHDGDLDLLQVQAGVDIRLVGYKNTAVKNEAPGTPTRSVAIPVFDRLFLFWEQAVDDHTAPASLTYDLYLSGHPEYQVAAFDLLNDRRLLVAPGNNGTQNFKLYRDVPAGGFGFSVQAVDNAFHGSVPCIGSGGTCGNVSVTAETLTACSKEQVQLDSPPGAYWFSFAKGFLGRAGKLTFQADDPDTLFYYDPGAAGCGGLKAWKLTISNDTVKYMTESRYVCADTEIQFAVEDGWENIHWESQGKGDLGAAGSITYLASQPDSVKVTLTNSMGCTIVRKTAVIISKPVLLLGGDSFKILKGSAVTLDARGAERYLWSPATGLSQTDIANPVASPATSLQYVVTGYDSLGCSAQATVNILVEGAGFIPNLFTPNDDGKNDQLKIYGMPAVKNFTLSIYNREGSLVFRTSNVSEAVQSGWDGAKNGTKQPAGVYFWKVEGEVASGGKILLNGKDSGSIVLVR